MASNFIMHNGVIFHYGIPGMKWGFHRGRRPNGDLILDYTGKRLSKYSVRSGYRNNQAAGTSALLPAIVSPRNMAQPYSKINPKQISKGSTYINKKLKIGLTVAALVGTTVAVTATAKAVKKKKQSKEKSEAK